MGHCSDIRRYCLKPAFGCLAPLTGCEKNETGWVNVLPDTLNNFNKFEGCRRLPRHRINFLFGKKLPLAGFIYKTLAL
ncbi:hypothetical protein EB241_01590 [Erwinia psidii]|uniref:Uncharacterized protein n=1 Tax=Erwinia psidii TaxID=69224 RepID=A0A3N6TXM6_9GAMM|nr:hypothetical protein EB241_01590 [Erwinia psidii]